MSVEPEPEDFLVTLKKKKKPPETEEEKEKRANSNGYLDACRMLGLVPVNYIARHINDRHLVMKSHPLGPQGTRAVCVALIVSLVFQVGVTL